MDLVMAHQQLMGGITILFYQLANARLSEETQIGRALIRCERIDHFWMTKKSEPYLREKNGSLLDDKKEKGFGKKPDQRFPPEQTIAS
jgi:hypothetical protein